MAPRVLKPTPRALRRAAALLARGRLVALPTETVYGLAGDATDRAAVARIYAAERRPAFNPLIVHVANTAAARRLARFDARALRLAQRFWPGPLTLVLPRRAAAAVPRAVAAGRTTLAIRVPAHPVALRLLQLVGRPIAAPSANPSGKVSPTAARDVGVALGRRVALILDAGRSPVGLESTVVDLSGPRARLLRPGAVTREQIVDAIGPVEEAGPASAHGPLSSPGQLASHYAPELPLRLDAAAPQPGEAYLAFGAEPGTVDPADMVNLSRRGDLAEAAANLFAALRALDRPCYRAIAVAPIPETGIGAAINDRLRRAAAPRHEGGGSRR